MGRGRRDLDEYGKSGADAAQFSPSKFRAKGASAERASEREGQERVGTIAMIYNYIIKILTLIKYKN